MAHFAVRDVGRIMPSHHHEANASAMLRTDLLGTGHPCSVPEDDADCTRLPTTSQGGQGRHLVPDAAPGDPRRSKPVCCQGPFSRVLGWPLGVGGARGVVFVVVRE